MAGYWLERTLPSGEVKSQGPHRTRWSACQSAGYVIWDNRLGTRKQAGEVAVRLSTGGDGEPVEFAGYSFRLVQS